jgi:GntR family transcriptional repressor for pyruvate dehydrogenase complex
MFVPIKNKKVYEYVIEQIKDMIMDGELHIGDRLPSERDLSEKLGVCRASVREALRSMEIIGLIEIRQGEGSYITGDMETRLFEPLSMMFALRKSDPMDILQLRMIIEVGAASMAAQKITEEQAKELSDCLKNLINAVTEEESVFFDTQLHYKIAEISGNYLIIALLNTVASLISRFIKNARGMILVAEGSKQILINQHKEICDAILARDPEKAEAAMKAHMETINQAMPHSVEING